MSDQSAVYAIILLLLQLCLILAQKRDAQDAFATLKVSSSFFLTTFIGHLRGYVGLHRNAIHLFCTDEHSTV